MKHSSLEIGTCVQWSHQPLVVESTTSRRISFRDTANNSLVTRPVGDVKKALNDGNLVIDDLLSDSSGHGSPRDEGIEKLLSDYPERSREAALVKRHFLRAICPNGRMKVARASLPVAIHEAWRALPEHKRGPKPPSVTSFYSWRHQWLRAGGSDRALVNRFDLRGRRPQPTPKSLAPIIERVVDTYFATPQRPTVSEVHKNAIAIVDQANTVRLPFDKLPRPTRRQIVREIERLDRYELLKKRHGTAHARTATRVFSAGPGATMLLERVEVDHTPLDIICVSEDGTTVIGRPFLTIFIDVATRMILAAWISFREPNANTVLRALKQAILPKDELLKQYKLKGTWPVRGVPVNLWLDNGKEFHSDALEKAAQDLGISLVYCPPRQPFFKGVVERFLKEINYSFIHLLPGTTFSKYYLRGEYDSQEAAVLSIDALRRLVYRWVTEVYAKQFHRGIDTCPLAKWRELAPRHPIVLPRRIEVLDVCLRPAEERTLSSKGIEINSLFYVSSELKDLRLRKGNLQLTVRPDPDDLGRIQALHPETNTYFEAQCTRFDYAQHMTLEQHKCVRQLARAKYRDLDYESALMAAKLEIREEALGAIRRAPAPGQPLQKPKARTSGVTRQSQTEIRAQAEADARAVANSEAEDEALGSAVAADHAEVAPLSFDGIDSFPSGQTDLF